MTMDECVSVFKLKIQITVYPSGNQHIKALNNEEKNNNNDKENLLNVSYWDYINSADYLKQKKEIYA